MIRLANIVNCVVIKDFNDAIYTDLKDGGNNVIVHDGLLWIPNMSCIALIKAKTYGYVSLCYGKQDVLPENAPMSCLKAIDTKLGEFMIGMEPHQKEDFVDRLINAVGYAGYYNRHRYKMPEYILCQEMLK